MLQNRLDYISDVSEYIRNSKSVLNDVLNILGWQKEEFNNNEVIYGIFFADYMLKFAYSKH